MGHRCSRPAVATAESPRPTSESVTGNLEGALLNSAKGTLQQDWGITLRDGSSLQDYTDAMAKSSFSNHFKYQWDPTNPSPPNVDKENRVIQPAADYCIIKGNQNISQAVKNYVDGALESASNLQSWMKAKATADLAAVIGKFASYPSDNEWHYALYTEKYNSNNPKLDSFQLDVVLVYTNATRTESSVDVALHIFYFVGVYYTIPNPASETSAILRGEAYEGAQNLDNVTERSISDDTKLSKALNEYTSPVFKKHFKYPYGGDSYPPDYAGAGDAIHTWSDHLAYFDTNKLTDDVLGSYVHQNIMAGLQIPVDGLNKSVENAIKADFKGILSRSDSGSWNSIIIDQDLGLQQAKLSPIRFNACIVYWFQEKTIDIQDTSGNSNTVDVYMIYLYFMGEVYELMPDPIMQDMKDALSRNVPSINTNIIPRNITPTDFRSFVETFNGSVFSKKYGITFPATSTSKVKAWTAFFEFDSLNPTLDAIKEAVEMELFGANPYDNEQIHHGLQKTVYDFIVKYFGKYSDTHYLKEDNQWYSETKENNWSYKDRQGYQWLMEGSTSWVFANGVMTEDGRGAETVNHFYLSLFLHIVAAPEEDSDSDV